MAQAMLPSDRRVPAILGGSPAFPEGLPLVRPSVPNAEALANDLRRILESRHLTNGPYVRRLEERAAEYLGVRHCVAVASCTAGLMLVIRATELTGDVIVPSFTFAATAHAVAWNGLRPVFADIDPGTLTLSPQAVRRAAGVRTSAILATHVYGTPCDIEGLAAAALEHGVRLFFDAAHAFGSRRKEKPVGGFGHAEVFSLSPTKVMVAGEGGIIATNDDVLAERCRIGRDYGNPGDYDCLFVGLNARMSELHAALAIRSLDGLEERLERRNSLARAYFAALAELPGISFPQVPEGSRSTFKDFTILVDPDAFGLDAAHLGQALAAEGVETRRYYAPPVHTMRAYRYLNGRNGHLPVTEQISARVLTLPLWSDMTESPLLRVAEAIGGIHRAARLENLPPVAGEKIPRLEDGPAGLRAYGNGGSERGRDG
jgi:dTDP-4-amino-4,6-dideoxygalactose transaminase